MKMKMTTNESISRNESAFIALKKRCDGSVLFSKNLLEITKAEIAYIHAISGCNYIAAISGWDYEAADLISSKFSYPKPLRTLCTHPECYLYIYEDNSLFDSNTGESVVYADYSDYVERVGRDSLTLCEREFFKIDSPDDDEALDFVVNIRKYYNDFGTHEELAKDYYKDKILTFASRDEAQTWIIENEPNREQLYYCSRNEYARPSYTVIAR